MLQKSPTTWRSVIKVHPAADLFPTMSEPELRELGQDIKKHGLKCPIFLYSVVEVIGPDGPKPSDYVLLDGRNRLDAMELVGIPFELAWKEKKGQGTDGGASSAKESTIK